MKNYETFDVYYDEAGDFLEVSFGIPPETEYTEDVEEGVLQLKTERLMRLKASGFLTLKLEQRKRF
jgi:hypothetical protein